MTTPPNLLPLPALREDNPRDFLAALGLLFCLNRCYPNGQSTLLWCPSEGKIAIFLPTSEIQDSWAAVLSKWLKVQFSQDDLEPELHKLLQGQLDSEYAASTFGSLRREIKLNALVFAPTAKIDPDVRAPLFRAAAAMKESNRSTPASDLHAALMSQVHNGDPDAKKRVFGSISDLSMANKQGQKYLLFGAQQIAMNHLTPESLAASFAGNATASSAAPNLRLSYKEGRDAAYFGAVPEFEDHPALNLLAFFGIPFYPVVDGAETATTSGFCGDLFRWPEWCSPLSEDVLRTLLLCRPLVSPELDPVTLTAVGVRRVWKSRRYEANKSLFFARAEPA